MMDKEQLVFYIMGISVLGIFGWMVYDTSFNLDYGEHSGTVVLCSYNRGWSQTTTKIFFDDGFSITVGGDYDLEGKHIHIKYQESVTYNFYIITSITIIV